MPFVSIRHRVSNHEVWRSYFDADTERQRRSGATTRRVFRALDDHSDVVVLFQIESKEKFRPFLDDEDLKKLMAKAGVVSEPVVTYWEDCGGLDLRGERKRAAEKTAARPAKPSAARPRAKPKRAKKENKREKKRRKKDKKKR